MFREKIGSHASRLTRPVMCKRQVKLPRRSSPFAGLFVYGIFALGVIGTADLHAMNVEIEERPPKIDRGPTERQMSAS